MISLAHARTARPNTFTAAHEDGLWRIVAHVQATGSSPVYEVRLVAQVQERGVPRRHDAEGHPVLLLSRINEDVLTLETCVLHHNLPRNAYLLVGFAFVPERRPSDTLRLDQEAIQRELAKVRASMPEPEPAAGCGGCDEPECETCHPETDPPPDEAA